MVISHSKYKSGERQLDILLGQMMPAGCVAPLGEQNVTRAAGLPKNQRIEERTQLATLSLWN